MLAMVRDNTAAEQAEWAASLHKLIVDLAVPVVRSTIKRRFRSARNITSDDFDDVCADALSAIITRLRRCREGAPEIVDFESYAATIASNTADRFFAARAPQRTRLRNQIRYVLTTDARFSIRQAEGGAWLCEIRGEQPARTHHRGTRKLSELIYGTLAASSEPLDLSDLTTSAAKFLGISDNTDPVENHAGLLRDPSASLSQITEVKNWLARLWTEVCELPVAQRAALLLNLGSGAGPNAGTTMCTLTDLGVATFSALALALEMTERQLADLWNRIPLEDKEIAEHLNLERQQVINLRASARQRLVRRMAAIDTAHTNIRAMPDTRGMSR